MDKVSRKRRLRQAISLIKDSAEILAILIAGLWALWIFIYQDRVLPAKIHLHLVASSNLEIIGEHGEFLAVRARVKVSNNSKVQARILGAWFNMRAYFVADNPTGLSPEPNIRDIETQAGEEFLDLPRQAKISGGEIVNSGRLMQAGWWLEPDEEQTIEFVTFVPKKFDLVRLKCHFRLVKDLVKPDMLVWNWIVNKDGSVGLLLYVKDETGKTEAFNPTRKEHRALFGDNVPLVTYATSYAVLWEKQVPITANPYFAPDVNRALRGRRR